MKPTREEREAVGAHYLEMARTLRRYHGLECADAVRMLAEADQHRCMFRGDKKITELLQAVQTYLEVIIGECDE